jgi:protein-tyrosine phosphatase
MASSEIFWINGNSPPGLAIVLRPRGGDWLEDELSRMRLAGITTLVSLLEDEEALELGLGEEKILATKAGMTYLQHPIPDRHTPPDSLGFRQFVKSLVERLQAGERIGVHCRGSIGRASITAACTLIHLGWNPGKALAAIEAARGCTIPDTPEQRDWILRYRAAA